MTLPTMPQYRKIRRIIGEYTFTGSQEEHFSDSIGFVGDFRASGNVINCRFLPCIIRVFRIYLLRDALFLPPGTVGK